MQWVEIVEAREAGKAEPLPAEVQQATRKDGRKKGPQHMPSGLSKAARNLNVPRSTLQQAAKIAKLAPEAIGQLAEIAENLHRREITALERDELVVRWAELVEERKAAEPLPAQVAHPMRKDGKRKGPQHMPSGISQTARELNTTRDDIRRAMKVGKLSPEAKAAAHEHGLADNRAALLEAAKAKTPETQVAAIQRRAVVPFGHVRQTLSVSGTVSLTALDALR